MWTDSVGRRNISFGVDTVECVGLLKKGITEMIRTGVVIQKTSSVQLFGFENFLDSNGISATSLYSSY